MKRTRTAADGLYLTACAAAAVVLTSWRCYGVAAPTKLVAMPMSETSVQLLWVDNSNDEEGFRVFRDGGSGFEKIGTTGPDSTGYKDETVTAGEFYTYYVVAFIGVEESAHSNHATVEAGEPYVSVLTPTSGEVLTLGEMYDVTWVTNMPDFDAQVFLSTDGGATWPPQHQILFSWAPNGSPWTWKAGYRNVEEDPTKPPVWERVLTSTCAECRIWIAHYEATYVSDWSEGTFTIVVEGDKGGPCGVGAGAGAWALALFIVWRRRRG